MILGADAAPCQRRQRWGGAHGPVDGDTGSRQTLQIDGERLHWSQDIASTFYSPALAFDDVMSASIVGRIGDALEVSETCPVHMRGLLHYTATADTVQLSALRKDALAAVEELKTKGSDARRSADFWGQVGVGAVAGAWLKDPAAFGFDFAFSALFIGILAGFWKGPRTGAVLAASAVVAATAKLTIPGAWYIVLGGLAGVLIAVLLHAEKEEEAAEAVS